MSTARHATLRACEQRMRTGSRSFHAAARLLPARVRTPATALYAFCRVADDAIDLAAGPADALAAVAEMRARLDAIWAGAPQPYPEDEALAATAASCRLPRAPLDALLDGFAWDAQGRQYETLEDLHAYGARVAGTVGTLMAVIMGARSAQALARAAELGIAMQLTNIARDVGEDARAGRLYLPRRWLRDAGIDPDAWLAAPRFSSALGSVVARLLHAADALYARAATGIAELPRDCRPAIQAARIVYAEIGRAVEQRGLDSVTGRAVVSRGRQLALLAWSLRSAVQAPATSCASTPLPAVRFLVDGCLDHTAHRPDPLGELPRRNYYERTVWVIDLCERLAERRRGVAA